MGEGSGRGLKGTAVCCGLVKLPFYFFFFSPDSSLHLHFCLVFFPMLGTGSSAKMMSCYLKKIKSKKKSATITKKKSKEISIENSNDKERKRH